MKLEEGLQSGVFLGLQVDGPTTGGGGGGLSVSLRYYSVCQLPWQVES